MSDDIKKIQADVKKLIAVTRKLTHAVQLMNEKIEAQNNIINKKQVRRDYRELRTFPKKFDLIPPLKLVEDEKLLPKGETIKWKKYSENIFKSTIEIQEMEKSIEQSRKIAELGAKAISMYLGS